MATGTPRPRRRTPATLLAAALFCSVIVATPLVSAAGPRLRSSLISRTSSGNPANGDSSDEGGGSAISGDGRVVVFFSKAANLPGGNGSGYQVYARDVRTGRTRLASTKANGHPADGFVFGAAISANGRFVTFYGPGNGLPGADGLHDRVWRHDLRRGTTVLVSKANSGAPASGGNSYCSVSATGRYVAFQSSSANLPGGDGTKLFAYLRDMRRHRTTLLSRTPDGDPAFGTLYGQSVSSSGRFAVFRSDDAGLPGGDGSTGHIYLRDRRRRRTLLIDRTSKGKAANGAAYSPSISANGRSVGFESFAANLGASPTNEQAFLRQLKTRRTILVSRNNSGAVAQMGSAYAAHPSGDGSRVAFESSAVNLPGSNGNAQIYVHDLKRKTTRLVSRTAAGKPGNDYSNYPSISANGRWAAFYGASTNLGGSAAPTDVFRSGPIH